MTEDGALPQEATGRRPRFWLYAPYVGLTVLCLAWTAVWFFVAHRAGQIADGFVAREGERGRDWVCPDRQIGGFPFRIEIACVRPQLIVREHGGLRHEGSLAGLSFQTRITSPGHFIAVLSPPFVARHGEAGEMEISWKSAKASLRAGNEGIGEFSAEIIDPVLGAGPHGRQDIRALAKGIKLDLRRSPGNEAGTDLAALITDMTFAPLDNLTGNPSPIRIELQANAPGLIADPARRFQDIVEEWRQTGKKARVVLLQAVKGQANLDLSGVMGLDGLHRLEGNLQGRAKGLDALTGALTRRGGLDLGGVLGKLGGGQGLPVALTFQNGRARFGPFPLFELQPLY